MTAKPSQVTCPLHDWVEGQLRGLDKVQKDRPCGENSQRISTLEKSDDDQWDAINDLRKTTWTFTGKVMGFATAAAFAGSLISHFIIAYIAKH